MRTLNMIMGGLFILGGFFMIFKGGVTFLSVAFVVGLLLILAGAVECLSYKSYRGVEEDNKWVLIDGFVMFILGILIISNRISADASVPLVLGLWVLTIGVRNLVRAWEKIDDKSNFFYGHGIIGLVNLFVGLYMFFNDSLLAASVASLVGICLITQGTNLIMVASTIVVMKHEKIMTKEELLTKAVEEAGAAHEAAKEAIKMAKEAKANVRVIEETPEEELDLMLAPKPGEATSTAEGEQEAN